MNGSKCGNSLAMISRSLCLETALNIFLMSSDTRARVGRLSFDSGWDIYFSTPRRIVCTIVEMPPCTPMA